MSPRAKTVKNGPVLQENASVSEVLTFEDALAALEGVIGELEKEGLSLDRALTIFEQGIILMRKCDSHLKNAQGKIKELLKGENGELVEKVLGDTLESFLSRDEKQ
jgi:exodeoxyribonuclease VII small subunit